MSREDEGLVARLRHVALDGSNYSLTLIAAGDAADRIEALAAEVERLTSFVACEQALERRHREDSNARVRSYGYEPRELQWKWRNDPPQNYDQAEVIAAICDALVHEGVTPWSGDATSCVEQIVRKQFDRAKAAEAALDRERARSAMLWENCRRVSDAYKPEAWTTLADSAALALAVMAQRAVLAATNADVDGWLRERDQQVRRHALELSQKIADAEAQDPPANKDHAALYSEGWIEGGLRIASRIRALTAAPEGTQ